LIWLALDLVILAQAICFGPARYARTLTRLGFYGVLVLALGTALGIVLAISYAFHDRDGTYSAPPANLLMSALFVAMVLRQSDAGGQSIYIAYSKMLGTIAGSIVAVVAAPGSPLLLLGVPIACFDLTYIVLLHAKLRTLGLNPWTRW
jgi:hypothetical protein